MKHQAEINDLFGIGAALPQAPLAMPRQVLEGEPLLGILHRLFRFVRLAAR